MDLYGQEADVRLLAALLQRLDDRSVIDVGAERGGFVEALLAAGSDEVYAFEPEPENAGFLRARFRDDARVRVHECAVSSADRNLELHRSRDSSRAPVTFGHTVVERAETAEIAWSDTVAVVARSLGSLVETGEVPRRAGIVKIDTEGHDLAVVTGLGELGCDVVMVEHWSNLPNLLGPCPWSTDEMVTALRPRGFSHFAFIAHRGEFVTLKWDDGDIEAGYAGNLVFLHDRVLDGLLPVVIACASELAEAAVRVGEMYATAANERLAVIDELVRDRELHAQAAQERLAVIAELQAAFGRGSRMLKRRRSG
jgi:FkbM family methyltransferase